MTTSTRIAEARKKRQLTQRQLADAMGVSVQAVSQWELGKNSISGTRIVDLAKALRVSVVWLLGKSEVDEVFDAAKIENVPVVPLLSIFDIYYYEIHAEENWNEFIPVVKEDSSQRLAYRIDTATRGVTYRLEDLLVFQLREIPLNGDIVFAATRRNDLDLKNVNTIEYRLGLYEYDERQAEHGGGLELRLVSLLEGQDDVRCAKAAAIVMAVMVEHRRLRPPRKR